MTGGAAPGDPILAVSGLTRRYGGIVAVNDVSFRVGAGTALGIIGPNGAGKTTLLNLISGLEAPDAGRILFRGAPVHGLKSHVVSRLGIARTFQTVRVFRELTVWENLEVADLFARRTVGREFTTRALDLLRFVGLEGYADTRAEALSYGQQKLLELAMVLMADPLLLLLDEPVAGVNPVQVARIGDLLRQLVRRGLTLLVVEHNVPFVVACCDTVLVMSEGRRLAKGPGDAIQRDERVLEAFLGGR